MVLRVIVFDQILDQLVRGLEKALSVRELAQWVDVGAGRGFGLGHFGSSSWIAARSFSHILSAPSFFIELLTKSTPAT